MDHKKQTLEELGQKSGLISSKNAVVGLDGFIDKIVRPVDQRHGPGDNYKPIETIAEFGNRISAAAGQSANIELYPIMEKLGGNGPIMANALLAGGLKTRYIGVLGAPAIDPVFVEFAEKTQAISLGPASITTAAEFKDGKIMLGNTASLDSITYDAIVKSMGQGHMMDCFSKADLISLVNWTMIPHMTSIFNALVDNVFNQMGPRENRAFFFDLADPAKRSASDISAALTSIKRFQAHGAVTLGLNYSESLQVGEVLGFESADDAKADEASLKKSAQKIRQELGISCIVIHSTDAAASATKDGSFWVEGPYTDSPVITTGAGDHFNAGFATGQLLGLSPIACLTMAVSFSGSYVRTAKSPSLSDISTFLQNWS